MKRDHLSARVMQTLALGFFFASLVSAQPARVDPLPGWNNGPAKKAIVEFVAQVTKTGGADFVPVAERIATFDNDGTLWSEQPLYFQFAFALDQVKAQAPQHPEWKTQQPFRAVLDGDMKALVESGEKGMFEVLVATHTGMTTDQFTKAVTEWINTAKHPRFKRPYTDLVFQPMLELLSYLRANGFKTYIVSGGTVDFMRVWAEHVYGIPPEQVVGTVFVTTFQTGPDGKPVLMLEPKMEFFDDGPVKPVNIQKFIGRRPILAFGNSDGDQQMLEWTAGGSGLRLMGLVHHTDADREWAYDRNSSIGKLDKALDEATTKKWVVVDMKQSWKVIYPFQKHRNSWPDGGMTPYRSEKDTNWEGAFRIPLIVRYPGKIEAGTVSNEIVQHHDWLPTFLELAGNKTVVEDLKKGVEAIGRTYKNHIDGVSLLGYLTGKEKKSPRKFFVYISDDGDTLGIRYDNWKVMFMEQRCKGTMQIWGEPFTEMRIPKIYNLRTDPYEFADVTSNTYWDWYVRHVYIVYGAIAILTKFNETFIDFPKIQKPNTFTADQAIEKLKASAAGS